MNPKKYRKPLPFREQLTIVLNPRMNLDDIQKYCCESDANARKIMANAKLNHGGEIKYQPKYVLTSAVLASLGLSRDYELNWLIKCEEALTIVSELGEIEMKQVIKNV